VAAIDIKMSNTSSIICVQADRIDSRIFVLPIYGSDWMGMIVMIGYHNVITALVIPTNSIEFSFV
jgi:hypothetical protein